MQKKLNYIKNVTINLHIDNFLNSWHEIASNG